MQTPLNKDIRNAYEMALTLTAMLLSFGAALWIEHAAGLHADVLVLAVVLTLSLSRAQRTADLRQRLTALVLIPAVAAVATLLGRLMSLHLVYGASAFTVLMMLPIWMRRFGPRATKAGTLITLPLVALLIVPRPALPPRAQGALVGWSWSVLIGLLAAAVVWLVQATADRFGPPPPPVQPRPRRRPSSRGPRPSTRMAVQMGFGVGVAFTLGKVIFDAHWPWVVFTAFLVGSGNRGRGDVVRKGIERLVGACAGTVLTAAVGVADGHGADGTPCVVLIFAVLAVALWLRPRSYAYWAAGMTTALALLYGYFGEDAQDLLPTRLGAIAVGAVVGVAAAWWVLPVGARSAPIRGAGNCATSHGGPCDRCRP